MAEEQDMAGKFRELMDYLTSIRDQRESPLNRIEVGIGEMRTGTNGEQLITCNLGSCVGVALYDAGMKIGALAHIKLWGDQTFKEMEMSAEMQPERRDLLTAYADTGIAITLHELIKMGGITRRITAKIAGGARMYSVHDNDMDVGKRNVKAVRQTLKRHGIMITGDDTGGNYGRTMVLDTGSGTVRIVSSNREIKVI